MDGVLEMNSIPSEYVMIAAHVTVELDVLVLCDLDPTLQKVFSFHNSTSHTLY